MFMLKDIHCIQRANIAICHLQASIAGGIMGGITRIGLKRIAIFKDQPQIKFVNIPPFKIWFQKERSADISGAGNPARLEYTRPVLARDS
jgi:hypothetical protein